MSIVLDLIIVGIVLLMVLISAKQGFVRIAVETVGFVLVLILATAISTPLADYTYQTVIEPSIVNSASDGILNGSTETVDEVFENLPPLVSQNAEKFGITREKVKETVVANEGEQAKEVLTKISQDLVKPVAVMVIEAFYSVIIIMLLSVVVKLIAKLLNKAFSFSVVGKANTVLGGVCGAVKGFVISVIFCNIVAFIVPFTQKGIWIFTSENISKTFIFELLTKLF